ncbi:MAG: hypothetical protein OEZ28_11685 [Nitrospinota bacterium]|nr:hypothetical protein [Nitrospinota bacterium]
MIDEMIREARRMLEGKGYQISSISTAQEGKGEKGRTAINILVSSADKDLQNWLRRSMIEAYPISKGVVIFRVSG